MKQSYTVGIGGVQPHSCQDITAKTARAARWLYVNLYAPPCTRYHETWCNGVKAQQPRNKARAAIAATQP